MAGIVALGCFNGPAATVRNLSGSGTDSLRAAILNASADPVIDFAAGLSGTIYLGSELQIQNNLTINGPGANVITVSGGKVTRVFHNFPYVTAAISGLTIADGIDQGEAAQGAGVLNEGKLVLNQCHITRCSAAADPDFGSAEGGGIHCSSIGDLAMNGCTVSFCYAFGYGNGYAFGGGVYSGGSIGLTNCTIAWNNARGGTPGGMSLGGGIYCDNNPGASRALVNCTVTVNSVGSTAQTDAGSMGSDGGGIVTDSAGMLHMINSIAVGNHNVNAFLVAGAPMPESKIRGNITSGGNNIVYGGDPMTSGYIVNGGGLDYAVASVELVRLGDQLLNNGGHTPTLRIFKTGQAFDHGNDAVLSPPYNLTTDQSGQPRFQGLHVDVGAYEAFVPPICSVCLGCCAPVSWNFGADGRWDFSSNWTPPSGPGGSNSLVMITNSGIRTIFIDSFTPSNSLTISDLLLSAPSNSVNKLQLTSGPSLPFNVLGRFTCLVAARSTPATLSFRSIPRVLVSPVPMAFRPTGSPMAARFS